MFCPPFGQKVDSVPSQSFLHRLGPAGVRKEPQTNEFCFNRVVPTANFPREQWLQKRQETIDFIQRQCKKQEPKCFPSAGPHVPLDVFRYNRIQPKDRVSCHKPLEYNSLECDEYPFAGKPNQRICHLLPPAGISTDNIGDIFRFSMVQPRFDGCARGDFESRMWNESNKILREREELTLFNSRPYAISPDPQVLMTRPSPYNCCCGHRC